MSSIEATARDGVYFVHDDWRSFALSVVFTPGESPEALAQKFYDAAHMAFALAAALEPEASRTDRGEVIRVDFTRPVD